MPEKIENDFVTVEFVWSQANPDPLQYKPYNPTLLPKDVCVSVQVPRKYVIKSEGGIVLTPEGLGYVCKQIAVGISTAYREES